MDPCPGKSSHINHDRPPRRCTDACGRFLYAAHLTGKPWIKPAIRLDECPNYVSKTGKGAE